ncbi:MAG: SiaB family protein kinase [Bacteroidota bacterium]|nr:SiaB family protein kinase [Bacteroidota bacterium]
MDSLILMRNKLSEHNAKSTYDLFEMLQNEHVEYVYRGNFDTAITDGILSLSEVNFDEQKDSLKIRKRVFFILVEGLQNITRHQDVIKTDNDYNEGFLVLQKKNNAFRITTGNLIKNNTIQYLTEILEKVNSLTKNELKEYYRKILNNQAFSEKGGAGLGLIEIARKSGNKILFDFQKVSKDHSYFYMQTAISLSDNENNKNCSLDKMKEIHRFFIKHDITLNVTGIFNHDKLVYLISILESQLSTQIVLKNKIFSIMIELMQNIVKHADEIEKNGITGKHSIFLITENKKTISITSGNYIKTEKAIILDKHISVVNKMTQNQLNEFHFKTLSDYKEKKENTTGLGILNMRIKSRQKIDYKNTEIDKDFTFFKIKVILTKEVEENKIIEIKTDKTTPAVTLNQKSGKFIICGDSFPINAKSFYKPIIKWISEYKKNPRIFTQFDFKFRFLSTSSQKELIKLFSILEEIAEKNAMVINWHFEKNNDDGLNFGIELSKLFKIDFNVIEFNEFNCNK